MMTVDDTRILKQPSKKKPQCENTKTLCILYTGINDLFTWTFCIADSSSFLEKRFVYDKLLGRLLPSPRRPDQAASTQNCMCYIMVRALTNGPSITVIRCIRVPVHSLLCTQDDMKRFCSVKLLLVSISSVWLFTWSFLDRDLSNNHLHWPH